MFCIQGACNTPKQVFCTTLRTSSNHDFGASLPALLARKFLYSSHRASRTAMAAHFEGIRWHNSTLAPFECEVRHRPGKSIFDFSCRRFISTSSLDECRSRNFGKNLIHKNFMIFRTQSYSFDISNDVDHIPNYTDEWLNPDLLSVVANDSRQDKK